MFMHRFGTIPILNCIHARIWNLSTKLNDCSERFTKKIMFSTVSSAYNRNNTIRMSKLPISVFCNSSASALLWETLWSGWHISVSLQVSKSFCKDPDLFYSVLQVLPTSCLSDSQELSGVGNTTLLLIFWRTNLTWLMTYFFTFLFRKCHCA